MSIDILTEVIRMQSPGFGMGEPCCGISEDGKPCQQTASGFHSLPRWNGDIVSNDFPDGVSSGNATCCQSCYERHAAGRMPVADEQYTAYLDRRGTFVGGSGI